MRTLLAAIATAVAAVPLAAQTWKIEAVPNTAQIFRVGPASQGGAEALIGTGSATFKVEKNDPNAFVVRLEGYKPFFHSFQAGVKPIKNAPFIARLTTRIVNINVQPYNADIFVNGTNRGQRTLALEVEENKGDYTVEVRLPGYWIPPGRVLKFGPTTTLPADLPILLEDRAVEVSTQPSDAAITVGGTQQGIGNATIRLPNNTCVVVKAEKPGFLGAERSYCNKPGLPAPVAQDQLVLSGRIVNLSAPPEAKIFVNQKQAGVGSFAVTVLAGSCTKVRVEQPGFVSAHYEWCDQANNPVPPLNEVVQLQPDDSYPASEQSDQANVNITVEPGSTRLEESAWKLLSAIVLTHFDVLENSDRETGYLRTAWQVKTYSGGKVIIRSRIIVKRSSTDPLRYTVKIASERNDSPTVSVKDDEHFVPWERLLSVYKDVISEMQSRLQ